MKIYFDGAAQTVTGSQHRLVVNGKTLLLDCGLFQGKRQDFYERNWHFDYDPKSVDAVILSHAHLDHSGNLPNLVKNGFRGPIYCTPPTAKLADIMLQDSGHIQEADIEYVNKKRARRGEEPMEPLYTIEDAVAVGKHFLPIKYDQPFEPVPGVTVRFVNAGHILGSAAIVLDIVENGSKKRLWFSGDIGRFDLPLLPDPVMPSDVDYLMMECTYGDKPHTSIQEAYAEFSEVVQRTVKRGGKVIIPAFAVGRTQEIVYGLNQMVSEGLIEHIPVYVDSPLAVNTSDIFLSFPEYFDDETRKFMIEHHHPALDFKTLRYVRSVEESKSLNDKKGPMIIISASGMAEAGRILHHLKNNVENPKNTIMIVSWQAPDTLGRRLAERATQVRIFGQLYDVRAEIATIGGLSAHAGQELLLKYAQAANHRAKQIFLVHGDPDAEMVFEQKLKEAGVGPICYPQWKEEVDI